MPGAWERHYSVLVGILHTDNVTLAWSLGLKNLIIPNGGIFPVAGQPFDMARNSICQAAIDNGCSHCLHLDSDVVPPSDAILRLLAHDLPIVSGMYCRRSPPHAVPVMMRNRQWVTNFRPGELLEVDVVGAGCLLIKTDLLKAMPPVAPGRHWFSWQVDYRGRKDFDQEMCMSEDFVFCTELKRKLGVKTFVDTSVHCRHVGYAEAQYNRFVPMETLVRT